MTDSERTGRFDHLLSAPVRQAVGESPYGAWRSIRSADAVSLSFGFPFPEAFPADELGAAARTVLAEEPGEALQYTGGEYADRLPEAIADHERRRGVEADPGRIAVTNGATHAVDVVCRAFLDPGDALFVGAPTFMGALVLFRNYGVDVEGFPVDGRGMDVDAVAAELADRREAGDRSPTLLYTVPNFQNPTGATLARERRERLVELAAEHDFLVLADDAYGALRYDGEGPPPLSELDDEGRVVRVGTFSKTVAPGVRTGWIHAHPEVLEACRRTDAGGTSTFVRSVLGRYCAAGHLEDNVADLRAAYGRRRDHLLDALDAHMPAGTDWTEPAGGFFVWVTLPGGIDARELLDSAAEEGVTYLPGELFYPDGGGRSSLRLSFSHAPPEAMEAGVEALARATRVALEGDVREG